jgi:hypothetical protein
MPRLMEAAQSGNGKDKAGKPTKDGDAGWHVKEDSRGHMKSTYGYSVHTAVDEDGFIHRQEVTAGCEAMLALFATNNANTIATFGGKCFAA